MHILYRLAVLCALAAFAGCARPVEHVAAAKAPCGANAIAIVAANVRAAAREGFGTASERIERAARISLSCAPQTRSNQQAFQDRWRGANALILSAEFAHQAAENGRAGRLLHEGYAIMRELRPPVHVGTLTSTLLAERLESARHEMQGRWIYW
jgi:hypothetical protein